MEIIEIKTDEALERCYLVLKELREDLSFQNFTYLYQEAKKRDDYRLVGIFQDGKCIAVMGFPILYDFVHGKHLYVDDLVVTKEKRSSGMGAELLCYAETEAAHHQCQGLRLCTGIDRKEARRFYDRNGWEPKALAYKKRLKENPSSLRV